MAVLETGDIVKVVNKEEYANQTLFVGVYQADGGIKALDLYSWSGRLGGIYYIDHINLNVVHLYTPPQTTEINVSFWEAAKEAVRQRNEEQRQTAMLWADSQAKDIRRRPGVYTTDNGKLCVVKDMKVYDYWGNGEWDVHPSTTLLNRLADLYQTGYYGLVYVAGLPDDMVD